MSQLLHSKLHNLNIVLNLFFFSDHLEPCYECWKVKKKMGTVGSICQFEGFRKVRRIAAGLSKQFEFETVGFMDPFLDPTSQDKILWTIPIKKDVKVEEAKLILLRAGGEFCNLAKIELDLMAEYKKKLGNSLNPIWKRLQPNTREMCDVCNTSIFNAHFTCLGS